MLQLIAFELVSSYKLNKPVIWQLKACKEVVRGIQVCLHLGHSAKVTETLRNPSRKSSKNPPNPANQLKNLLRHLTATDPSSNYQQAKETILVNLSLHCGFHTVN